MEKVKGVALMLVTLQALEEGTSITLSAIEGIGAITVISARAAREAGIKQRTDLPIIELNGTPVPSSIALLSASGREALPKVVAICDAVTNRAGAEIVLCLDAFSV